MLLICMSTPTARQFCCRSACACSRSLFPDVVELVKPRRTPPLARTPSGPGLHPASSRICFAFSGLYSCFGKSALYAQDVEGR